MQFRHGGIASINGLAFFDQRRGELLVPFPLAVIGGLENVLQLFRFRLAGRLAGELADLAHAIFQLFQLAAIAAQQVAVQVHAVLHDLEANGFGRFGVIERELQFFLGAALLKQGDKRKADQQGQNAQHEAESVVKSFADCHMPLTSTLPRSSAARESLLRRGTELEFH